jgi:hypothetical protein
MKPPLTLERSGSVVTIHLSRPQVRNAVDGPTASRDDRAMKVA